MSAAKDKGDAFERAVAIVFREHGHVYAERMLKLGQHRDDGDIAGVLGFHVECKNRADVEHLSMWLSEAVSEAGDRVPVVVVKRRGHAVERAYVVLELGTFAELIADDRRNGAA